MLHHVYVTVEGPAATGKHSTLDEVTHHIMTLGYKVAYLPGTPITPAVCRKLGLNPDLITEHTIVLKKEVLP
jgi:hypothetical protein